jgi:hypothetical protein
MRPFTLDTNIAGSGGGSLGEQLLASRHAHMTSIHLYTETQKVLVDAALLVRRAADKNRFLSMRCRVAKRERSTWER